MAIVLFSLTLTDFQSSLLLFVTIDTTLEKYTVEQEAVILSFTSNFFVNAKFHSL